MKNIVLKVSEKDYTLDMIRYVSYTYSDRFWVLLKRNKENIIVELNPMNDKRRNEKNIKKEFDKKLKEEKLGAKITDDNIKLREFIVKNSFNYTKPSQNENLLTKEEEKELEKLIKEVEEELKNETKTEGLDDIKKTWEEKHSKKKDGDNNSANKVERIR